MRQHTLNGTTLEYDCSKLKGENQIRILVSQLEGLGSPATALQKLERIAKHSKGVQGVSVRDGDLICHVEPDIAEELVSKLLNRLASQVTRIRKLARRTAPKSKPRRKERLRRSPDRRNARARAVFVM